MNPEQVNQVAGYSGSEFGLWLLRGFEVLTNRSERFKAFAPIDSLIGFSRDQTVVDDLGDLFRLLGPDGQRSFKEGMQDALSRTLVEAPGPSVPVVDSLLLLAQQVHATNVLPEIEKLVADPFLRRFPENERASVFARAFETVRAYRGYHDVARILLDQFVLHPLFRPGYGLRALVACLVSDRSRWSRAFGTLRPKLALARMRLSAELAFELKTKIRLDDVRRAVERQELRLLGSEEAGFGSDDWFVSLFGLHAQRDASAVLVESIAIAANCYEDLRLVPTKSDLSFPSLQSLRPAPVTNHVRT